MKTSSVVALALVATLSGAWFFTRPPEDSARAPEVSTPRPGLSWVQADDRPAVADATLPAPTEPSAPATPATTARQEPPSKWAAAHPERPDYRAIRRALDAKPALPLDGKLEPVQPLPAAPAPEAWADVEIVPAFGAGSPAPSVNAALAALRPRLLTCFEPYEQARYAQLGDAYSRLEATQASKIGPAILMLEVEREGAGVRLVDAPIESTGSASAGLLNCAQSVLRGASLEVSEKLPEAFRMRMALKP